MELYAVKNQNLILFPDDYVCCRETNLSVECLIHDKVAAKKRYQNLIIDNASIEDIMLFYIKGGVK